MSENNNADNIIKSSKSDEVTKRLLELIDRYDYQLVQENGQRRLTSVGTDPRIKGAEIFLGRLPRDCYEDELVPLLMGIGRVIELRLMMDFSGSTRGYAFATFENPRIARKACDKLNSYEIRPGHRIGVVKSIDNCRLFLGGVPKDKTKADFSIELGKMLDGITNIYVYPSTENKALNRGFVFVEFKDHRSAAMARRKLIPGRVMLWDHEVAVDWAEPEPGQDIDDEIMETVSALFVRNLAMNTPESDIRHIIQRITGIQIMKIKKINHFAFLHYETRAQAQRVLDIMKQSSGSLDQTSEWELTWAKPIRKTEKLAERIRCEKNNQGNKDVQMNINYYRGVRGGDDENRKNQNSNNNNNNNNSVKDYKKKIEKYMVCENVASPDSFDSTYSAGAITMQNYNCENQFLTPVDLKLINKYETNAMLTNQLINMNKNQKSNNVPFDGESSHYNDNYDNSNNRMMIQSTTIYTQDDLQLVECARALGELAAVQFHANIRYEYCTDGTGNQYYCKIILERNGCELMSYQGNPAFTLHEAITTTVPNAYARMQSMLMNKIKHC